MVDLWPVVKWSTCQKVVWKRDWKQPINGSKMCGNYCVTLFLVFVRLPIYCVYTYFFEENTYFRCKYLKEIIVDNICYSSVKYKLQVYNLLVIYKSRDYSIYHFKGIRCFVKWEIFDTLYGHPSHVTSPFEYRTPVHSSFQINPVFRCPIFWWLLYWDSTRPKLLHKASDNTIPEYRFHLNTTQFTIRYSDHGYEIQICLSRICPSINYASWPNC